MCEKYGLLGSFACLNWLCSLASLDLFAISDFFSLGIYNVRGPSPVACQNAKHAEFTHSSQMSDPSTRDNDAAASANQAQSATTDYARSSKLAQDKTTQCAKFLTFARFIRDQANFSLRSAGQHPSEEEQDSLRGLRQQWQDLQNNKLLDGAAGDVLTQVFVDEAELELGKLDETDTAATQARAAWQGVVSLIGECKTVRQEVDQVMAKMQSLLS